MVFDKTGTLTEDGLQVHGFRGVELSFMDRMRHKVFSHFTPECTSQLASNFLEGIVSCHSITYIDGVLIGDPLDVKMFQKTGWHLEDQHERHDHVLCSVIPPEDNIKLNRIDIIRRFDFSSKLQRMSVITSSIESNLTAIVKGSPERIRELCLSESIPSNFDEILNTYTQQGYRVLSMASKNLDPNV